MLDLLLTLPLLAGTPSDQRRPDVVIFFIDDVAAVDMDEAPTPNIDSLASLGTRFLRGYAQPNCAPARLSIMHSEWQGTRAGNACNYPISPRTIQHGRTNLAKVVEGAGYETAYFGRWGLGGNVIGDPDDYPWTPQLWGWETTREVLIDGSQACIPNGDFFNWESVNDGIATVSNAYVTTAMCDAFVEWWPTAEGPRLAFVSFQAAHDPFHWPPAAAMPSGWTQPTGPVFERAQYLAMIQSIDVAVGDMLQYIDLTRTLVILTADNGTPQGVAPLGQGDRVKFSTFERGVKVPFIVAGLGLRSEPINKQPVSIVDVVPTIWDAIGGEPREDLDGQSVLPAIAGKKLERGWIYVQTPASGKSAVIESRWKLTESPNGFQRIYDLVNDPDETNGVAAAQFEQTDVVERLRIELAEARS